MLNKIFRKQSESFGLDIGSSAVKVVQIRESGNARTLTGFGMVSLPNETITDGAINDPGTVADAIKEAVGRAGVKATDATISICGRELIIKKIQIPEVPTAEIDDVVRLEAEHHIPFAIDEVFIDHHVVGEHGGAMRPHSRCREEGEGRRVHDRRRGGGIQSVIVDVDGFALGNQFEANFAGEDDEAVALIDIGASIMKTNVIRAGASIFARDIPFGGNNYTQAIAQRLNISFEQAEAAKLGKDAASSGKPGAAAGGGVARPLAGGAADLRLLRLDGGVRAYRQDRAGGWLRAAAGAERISVIQLGHSGRDGPAAGAHPGGAGLCGRRRRAGPGAGRCGRSGSAPARGQGKPK